MQITTQIRQIARDLLEKEKVDAVIGYRLGSLAHMTEPFIAVRPDQTDLLVFNHNCRMNLAVYLTPDLFSGRDGLLENPGRVAVTAKGCDSRNIITQIQENRYQREQIHIIGVPCEGMTDKTWEAGQRGAGHHANGTRDQTGLLQANCRTCISPNPVIWDDMAGKPVAPWVEDKDRFADVDRIQAMAADDRAACFKDLLHGCTRCYACRNACPLCYCPVCFVDEAQPQWVNKTVDPSDVMAYHLIRAFHDAGRCTDCGACEAACPMDIPVRAFTRKTIRDVKTAYGWESGMDLAQRPPLDRFDLKDPEGFIR